MTSIRHLISSVPRFQAFAEEVRVNMPALYSRPRSRSSQPDVSRLSSSSGLVRSTTADSVAEDRDLSALYNVPLSHLSSLIQRLEKVNSCSLRATNDDGWHLTRFIAAIKQIEADARRIVEEQQSQAERDTIKRILAVELTLEGLEYPLLGSPNRRLVREGPVKIGKRKGACSVYLFNDLILLSERSTSVNRLIAAIYPYQLTLVEANSKLRLIITQPQGDPVEEVLNFKTKGEKFEWTNALEKFIFSYQANRVYGIPLIEVVLRENEPQQVPRVMLSTMRYVKEFGMTSEGIFRVPGDATVITDFKRTFDCGTSKGIDFRGCSVHDVSALLKLYLRELPDPLYPFSSYEELLELQRQFDLKADRPALIQGVSQLIFKLPTANQHVIHQLLLFLLDISQYSKSTKMGTSNLALVFAPNVIRPMVDSIDTAVQIPMVSRIFQFCIENVQDIWIAAEPPSEKDTKVLRHRIRNKKAPSLVRFESKYSMDNFDSLLDDFDPMVSGDVPIPGTLVAVKDNMGIDLSSLDSRGGEKSVKPKSRAAQLSSKTSPRLLAGSCPSVLVPEEQEKTQKGRSSRRRGTTEGSQPPTDTLKKLKKLRLTSPRSPKGPSSP